jgi:transposase-like protein
MAKRNGGGGSRRRADDALLTALACGATVEAAARQAGVSASTAFRRLTEDGLQAKLRDARGDMLRRSAGALTAASQEAVRTLLALQKDANPAQVRLGAARAVLEIGLRLRVAADIEVRLADLERQLRPRDGRGT